MLRYYRRGDIILTVLLLFLSVVSFAGIKVLPSAGKHVVVEVDGRRVLELPLDRDVTK